MKILRNKEIVNFIMVLTLLYLKAQSLGGILSPLREIVGFPGLLFLLSLTNIIIITNGGFSFFKRNEIIAVCLIVILGVVPIALYHHPMNSITLAYYPFQFVAVYLIFLFLRDFNNKKTNAIIAIIFFIEIVITSTTTLCYSIYLKNPITRTLTVLTREKFAQLMSIKNTYLIGGFGIVYACPIISLISLEKIKRKRVVYVIPLIISVLLIVVSSFFFSWIEFLICILVYVFFLIKEKTSFKKAVKIVLTLFLIAFMFFCASYHMHLLPSEINYRIANIIDWLKDNNKNIDALDITNYDNALENRLYFYNYAIKGIITNKFLYRPSRIILCYHSYLLDSLSLYGFLSIFLWYFYGKILKEVKNTIKCDKVFYAVLIYYVVHIALNHCNDLENPIIILIILPFMFNETVTEINKN